MGSFIFQSKRSYEMIRVAIVAMGSFLAKKVVKNRYYENENFGLAWDSIKWS